MVDQYQSAAGQLRRLPVVAVVANVLKVQLERCLESATRQVELGIPKEQAILNNLPTYAVACNEDSIAIDATDPYALTEENRAARNKAFEAIQATKAISAKLPRRQTKREQILAANIAEAKAEAALFSKSTTVKTEPMNEDEPISW